jgi:L,D-peptidoglycan transpeptidase YkuD (ErfK/YbiS/YcfS/YnhG family)
MASYFSLKFRAQAIVLMLIGITWSGLIGSAWSQTTRAAQSTQPGPGASAMSSFRLSPKTGQIIVGLGDGWDATSGQVLRYQRQGNGWQQVGGAVPCRFGAGGLVWGRGLSPTPPGARLKQEGDRRAPCGVFGLGTACGYAANIARHPQQRYFQVTAADLWVEDVASPSYNQHIRLPRAAQTPWELKQRMKLNEPAHALKLFILHNSPRTVPGAGSAIFFHVWRADGTRATSGCTTMAQTNLANMIAWVDPTQLPVYVLLPRSEYQRLRPLWGLP